MEKRKFSRTGFNTAGIVHLNNQDFDVDVIDLSLKGALFVSETPLKKEDQVELEIKLSNSDLSINTEGRIVHTEADHYGIRFTGIDAESMIHLRSLMEYNTENYERIGSELAFLYADDRNSNS